MEPNVQGEAQLQTVSFRIDGLSCSCESAIVEKRVKAVKGVSTFSFNTFTYRLKVTYDPAVTSVEEIQASVAKAGVRPVVLPSR